jgi:hypothetical protein
MQAVDSPTPPLRLPLGQDAYARIRSKLSQIESDLQVWEAPAIATGFLVLLSRKNRAF